MTIIVGGALLLAVILPFVLDPMCTRLEQPNADIAYRIVEPVKQSEKTSDQSISIPNANFSFLPHIRGVDKTVKNSETTYYLPEDKKTWLARFVCEVNGADYVLAWFTIFLAISTFFLWRETQLLAKGAADQSEKMRLSIREQRRSALAGIVAAKAAKSAAKAATLNAQAAVGVELPILRVTKISTSRDEDFAKAKNDWFNNFYPKVEIKNYGRTTAFITDMQTAVYFGVPLPKVRPEIARVDRYMSHLAIEASRSEIYQDFEIGKVINPIDVTDYLAAEPSSTAFTYYGIIYFNDFLGNPHEQVWAQVWVDDTGRFFPLSTIPAYNEQK